MVAKPLPPSKRCLIACVYFALAVVGIAGPGCTHSERRSGAIRIQLPTEPATLDPALAEDGASLRVLYNSMDGLVGYDGAGHLRNLLAETIVISNAGKKYDFTLRPQARWSDGVPVRAQDFVTGILRALHPSSGSKLAGIFFGVRGARAYFDGKGKAAAVAIREHQGHLLIELEQAAPYFIQSLSLPVAMPERRDVLDAHGGRWPDTAPCTGPYRIVRYRADREISFERNRLYWDPASEAAPAVEMFILADDFAALNLFTEGQLDILTKVPVGELPRLRREQVLHTDPFLATYYLSFNFHKAPFDQREWRQAVAGVIQREELVRALDSGDRPARSLVPPGLEGYLPYSDDPAVIFSKAISEVRKRGAPAQIFNAAFDSSQRNTLVMEKVQQDLKAGLGLKIALSNLDWKTYLKSLQTDPPPLFRLGILSPFLDPIQMLQSFTTRDPNNYLHWSNAEYDGLVSEISRLKPGAERAKKIRRAQTVLVDEEAIVVPIYHYVQNHAVSPRIENFRVNPFGVIRFNELKVKSP